VEFFHSNILAEIRRKLPLSSFAKKKVHRFSFVPFKGFSPWQFKKDRVLIYSIRFLFNRNRIKFYLVKKGDEINLCVEVIKGDKVLDYFFKIPIIRRNYDIDIIMTKSIVQFTIHKGKIIESVQFNMINSFFIGLIYGPRLGFRNNFIIKMEYK